MSSLPMPNRTNQWLMVLFAGVLVPLFLFGVLAEHVIDKAVFSFDRPILLFLHARANAGLDQLMIASSRVGSALVLAPFTVIVAILLFRQRDRMRTRFWVLAVAGAAILNLIAKFSFARARPTLWISILPETTFSFPSGHAMGTMAAVTAVVYLLRNRGPVKWIVIALGSAFVVLVGTSRVYLGVHYPSDVLAGWLASFAWVTGAALALKLR